MRTLAAAAVSVALLLPYPLRAQTSQHDVRGVVVDSGGAAVEGAMVVTLALPDSILIKFTLTGGDGAFRLRRVPTGDYVLQVTRIGYQTSRSDFSVSDADVNTDTVHLSVLAVEMDPLEVSVEHVPFINRGDTLSFNVLAFPTPANALVEDLLRRLPGFEVADDGSIRAMGKDVKNVLVEGKEFFGSDPTIATRNLPAAAVERVDVFDKQSDLAEFTGVPDGQEERTVDLDLREEAKQGYFGRLGSGLGADEGAQMTLASHGDRGLRYNETLSLNRFNPTTQLALVGNVNNTNQAGFAGADARGPMEAQAAAAGPGGSIGGGGAGFTESLGAGANASHDFSGGGWVRGSYFLGRMDNLLNQTQQQQQLLGSEVASESDRTSDETTQELSHRFNLNAQYAIADGHDVRLRGNLTRSFSSRVTVGSQETRTPGGAILNTASTRYDVDGDALGGDAALTWRKRLSEKGSALVAEIRANLNEPNRTANLTSRAGTPGPGDVLSYEEVAQEQRNDGRTLGQSQRLSLTQPLGEGRILELFGQRSSVDEDNSKSVYDLDGGTATLNDLLSSGFERAYAYLRGGMRFNRNTSKSIFAAGLQIQRSDLDGTISDEGQEITQAYAHVLPDARFRYMWRPGWSVDFFYNTSIREPTLRELQPLTENSDPVNVYVGNPDLVPEYRHNASLEYRHFDQFRFTNLYAYVQGSYVTNDIVQSRTVDDQGFQQVTPVNAGSGWTANLGLSYDTPIRRFGAKVNLGYDLSHARDSELLNGAGNESRITRQSVRARLENRHKEVFDVAAGGTVTLNQVAYSLNSALDQSYTNAALYANATWYCDPEWTFKSSLDYRLFDKDVFGPGQNVALLNAAVSRYVADKRGELELAAYDLLNQNQGVTFGSSTSSIIESRARSLRQYVMVRFVWRLGMAGGGFGGKAR